jgi:putative ATPase
MPAFSGWIQDILMPSDLFDQSPSRSQKVPAPLADRMRPRTLKQFVGQEHLLAEGKILRTALETGELPSPTTW